jgi:hypothetical protein
VAADSVFAVHDLPHRHQPLVQADGGILHHGPDFDGELRSRMVLAAFPTPLVHQEDYALGPALPARLVQTARLVK